MLKLQSTKYAQMESNHRIVVQQQNRIDINIQTDIKCSLKHRTKSINSIHFIEHPRGSKCIQLAYINIQLENQLMNNNNSIMH